LEKGCDWHFNIPLASHAGGVWERMIRSIRSILIKILWDHSFTEEQLRTYFCIAEDVINSRPITHVSNDPSDLRALSPNNLLRPNPASLFPILSDKNKVSLNKKWLQIQRVIDVFWMRWVREYLPRLQERTKWLKADKNLGPGDLVLLRDDNSARCDWPIGRIVEAYKGRDDLVRSALVKTSRGNYKRPISKICLLEGHQGYPDGENDQSV